jgi:hypothetical protein
MRDLLGVGSRCVSDQVLKTALPRIRETALPQVSKTALPQAPGTALPRTSETALPRIPETALPQISETALPQMSETALLPDIAKTHDRPSRAPASATSETAEHPDVGNRLV